MSEQQDRWLAIFNKKMFLMFVLGFSSGLPFTLVGTTLQAWFTVENASLVVIGWLGLLSQPYIFKLLWAPLLDRYSPPWLGRRRGWLLLIQLSLAILFFIMALLHPKTSAIMLFCIAFLAAFAAASQDIVLDAYRTERLTERERGFGSAVYIGGYRIAMLVSGGLAILVAARFGWHNMYILMALLMSIGIIATFCAKEQSISFTPKTDLWTSFTGPVKEIFQRRSVIYILLFLTLYKTGDHLLNAMLMPFLLRELQFTKEIVGFATGFFGLGGTLAGIFIGGLLLARFKLTSMLILFALLQSGTILFFIALDQVGPIKELMYFAISAESFCNGLGTGGLVALMMELCDKRFTATQFALFSALTNITRMIFAPFIGNFVEQFGFGQYFVLVFLASLPALAILLWQRNMFAKPVPINA